jgi:hypothetical protein
MFLRMVCRCSILFEFVRDGSKWFDRVRWLFDNRLRLFEMVRNGSRLFDNGSRWLDIVPNGLKPSNLQTFKLSNSSNNFKLSNNVKLFNFLLVFIAFHITFFQVVNEIFDFYTFLRQLIVNCFELRFRNIVPVKCPD